MCGIAGCFGIKDEDTINRMLDALTHRGPNDRGIHSSDRFTVCHTRLSIVDVATHYLPEEILWRYKVQYTQGAGCEDLGERIANKMSYEEFEHNQGETSQCHYQQQRGSLLFQNLQGIPSPGLHTGFYRYLDRIRL